MTRLLFLLTILISTPTMAASSGDGHDHSNCAHLLEGKMKLVPSGREGKAFDKFSEAAAEVFKDGGLFQRLGISRPYQVLHFMPGADVNAVGSVNGFPVAHWVDGSRLVRVDRSGLLYEIVISGKDEQYSFYRDDNSFEEQYSILLHAVAGHNHFTANSRFPHFMSENRIQGAFELSEYMDKIRLETGEGEVSEWYQFLMSLSSAQDFTHAHYQTPDDLVIVPPSRSIHGKKEPGPGFQPSSNVLQAFVANLPSDMPEWKKSMARRFERLHRFAPGLVRTKIMNEGWSTLMQVILPKHTPYNTFADGIHYCCLLSGITRKDLSNPYWLGLEAWKNVYARFQERPDIQLLPNEEARDGAFIRWASKEIIGAMDDEMFLKFGLDEQWVVKENLSLSRPYTEEEYEEAKARGLRPETEDPKKNWPHAIVSRDPKKVIQSLVNQQKSMSYTMPQPVVVSFNEHGNGNVALEMNDPVGRQVALDPRSMVETLFVYAQIQERPVSLESTFDFKEETKPAPYNPWFWPPPPPPPKPTYTKVRIKVTVNPMGDVRAQIVERSGSSDPSSLPEYDIFFDPEKHTPVYHDHPGLAAQLQEVTKGFLYNLTLGQEIQKDLFKPAGQLQALDESIENMIGGASVNMQLNIPTAPRAILEYENFLSQRLAAALKDAINGKGGLIRRPNGVQISAMPRIPSFQFDNGSLNREVAATPPTPIPRLNMIASAASYDDLMFRPGDFEDISPIPGREGDTGWGPKPSGGQGEGEGDEESNGPKPSEEGGEKNFETVSLDDYAAALAEEVKLPNLRPKAGLDIRKDDEMAGHRHKISGNPVNRLILKKAFKRGFPSIQELEEGADPFNGIGIIQKGLGRIKKENDWVVRNFEPKKNPDLNAVIFFQMDMSGSMEMYKATAKQVLYDLRALLKRKYKNITFVYITFNDKAFVFDDPEEFFRFKPNGGTRYAHSFKKVIELFENYPESQFDRFSVVTGDLDESLGPDEISSFQEMKEGTQFTTIIRMHEPSWMMQDLSNYFKGEAETDEYVGYVDIIPAKSYTPLIFKKAFKNEEE